MLSAHSQDVDDSNGARRGIQVQHSGGFLSSL
jgi:hypothetical protein